MKSGIAAAVAVFILVIFSSCQQVFMTNVFEWAAPDVSDMSDSQKVSYAEDLLSSDATDDELNNALTELQGLLPDDLSDPESLTEEESELLILAADLAVASSGVGDVLTDALDVVASGDIGEDALGSMLETINEIPTENLSSAVSYVAAAEASGAELTSEQYANAAAAQMLVIADEVGGVENLTEVEPDDPDLLQAQDWAEAAGVDIESFLAGGFAG